MADQPPSEKAIFQSVLEMSSAQEREDYLREACGDDAHLRSRVDALLAVHDRLPPTPVELDPPLLLTMPGTMIGRYKILEPIGEGGYGTVFMAEQTTPVQRRVALKIIKAGMDTRQVIARFEAERQALALMDHPNIAKVFDAGVTDTGRPYFVMELVKGTSITKYCDEKHLTPRDRLALFVQVCQAVQHAHQKGIIHRDIKPNNVLVALYDGKPVPKVIDFGVAKATGQQLTERTMFTGFGDVIGTLEYMSPEQAEVNQLDVDTRSDIYSLGVLLYELLTGTTPLEHKRVMKAGLLEMLRVVREEEPPRPSTRLTTTDQLPSIAAQRGVDPKSLSGIVRGELDWIVMKALEKNRTRRYETANGLATDVQRYLNDDTVQACPPSAGYRLRKFARRNKGPVLAGVLVLLALVSGIIGTTFGLVRAEQARRDAVAAQKSEAARAEGERLAKQEATEREAEAKAREAETQAVLDFVEGNVFAPASPEGRSGGLGNDVTLRHSIEAALPFMADRFAQQPLIEARLRLTLGASFRYLGEAKAATEQVEAARLLYAKHLGSDHPDTLKSARRLAGCYRDLGRHAEAFKLIEETLALTKVKLGPDHPDTLLTMAMMAESYRDVGRPAEAIPVIDDCVRRAHERGECPPFVWTLLFFRISYFAKANDPSGCRTTAEMWERMDPSSAVSLYNAACFRAVTAAVHRATDSSSDAARSATAEADRAMELLAKAVGVGYRQVAHIKTDPDLQVLRDREDFRRLVASLEPTETAVAAAREAFRLSPDNIERRNHLVWVLNEHAWMLATNPDPSARNPKRAAELAQEAITLAPDNEDPWNTLGVAQFRVGDWRAAIAALQKSRTLRHGTHEWGNPFYLAMAHWHLGDRDEARQWYDKGVRWMQSTGMTSAATARVRREAAELLGVNETR